MVGTTIDQTETPTIDIDDLTDLDDMPEMGTPAMSLADLQNAVVDHRLLPPGYWMEKLGQDDFAVEQPESGRRVRATISRDFYANHFDHTDFWTPGSAAFPIEGRPEGVTAR